MNNFIPRGWCRVPLPSVAQLNPPSPIAIPSDDTPVSFIPMSAVAPMSGELELSESRHWKDVRKGYTRFQEGDVLFAKITPCMENGKSAVARRLLGRLGAGSTEFHVLRPSEAITSDLLRYYVLQEDFRKAARAKMTGTAGQLRVPRTFLEDHSLAVPPLAEQHRIIEAIESYFTRLDDAVATMERAQRNLERYRASVLKAAVEGRLVPTEAEVARAEHRDYEPASDLLELVLTDRRRRWHDAGGRGKYREPAAPDTTDLPELPRGWCWATVAQLTSRITSGSRDWTRYYGRGTSTFVMAQNVRPRSLDLSSRQSVDPPGEDPSCERSRIALGDVLVTIVGANTGQVCLVPRELPNHYVCQSVALMRPVESDLGRYLDLYLNSPSGQATYRKFIYGQGRPHLSFEQLGMTPVPLPPRKEQVRISRAVDRGASVSGNIEQGMGHCSRRCVRLRQAILKWAFEGKLADQDPKDESVFVLLERIKAERVAAPPTKTNGRTRVKA